jgi:hypothetical protein
MSTPVIYGKILALSREYSWRPTPDGLDRQFFTGGDSHLPFSGIGLTWWLTRRGHKLLRDLARLAVDHLPDLALDRDSVEEAIEDVFQQNATSRVLFVSGSFMRCANLFESRAIDEAAFASAVWSLIEQALCDAVADWLIVVPIPRVKSSSYDVGHDGLALVAAGDAAAWRRVAADFKSAELWNSRTGHADPRDVDIMRPIVTNTWLACRARGTKVGANLAARERMRTFIALLVANYCAGSVHFLMKSMDNVPTYGTHFPETRSRTGVGYVQMHIGEIIPPLLEDMEVTADHVEACRRWYARQITAAPDLQKRAFVASQFVHYAVVADDIEKFIHFFIALDALFGVRGNVEKTIAEGIERTFVGDAIWGQRAHRLFTLRNELLHGGSSRIAAWAGYDDYEKHFGSEPSDDVALAALTAIRRYPV